MILILAKFYTSSQSSSSSSGDTSLLTVEHAEHLQNVVSDWVLQRETMGSIDRSLDTLCRVLTGALLLLSSQFEDG